MIEAGKHPLESARIEALRALQVLDSAKEPFFDHIAELVSIICHTPISLVSLVDESRQWFKAADGLDVRETPRDIAFCAHAILQADTLVVEDALKDVRFHDNPLVKGDPSIRFYAGQPLVTSTGLPLGTLCAIDRIPRTLTPGQRRALSILAHQVVAQFEARAQLATLQKEIATGEHQTNGMHRWLASVAHDIRGPFASVIGLSELLELDFPILEQPQIIKFIGDINRAARLGYEMLDNLLDLSLLKSGSKPLARQTIHVEGVLQKVVSIVSGLAAAKRITIGVASDPYLVIVADSHLVQSVVQNLATNAVKFTPSGGSIVIQASQDHAAVRIRVRDSGIGMSPEAVRRLNSGESIASSPGTAGEAGAGWGLRLAREFCLLNNATLSFASTLGKGTECTVRFAQAKT